jgi:DNA polymerase-3 subunit beta
VQILSYVKISAENGKVSLVATNLDTEACDSFDCDVMSSGVIAAPMATISEIVSRLANDANITLDLVDAGSEGGKKIILSANSSVFEIVCLPADDFPAVLGSGFDATLELSTKSLLDLMKKTAFSMSNNPDRYNLNGLLLHSLAKDGKNYLCAVSTDGHRLSYSETEIDVTFSLRNKVVPKKAISDMQKILHSDAENCKLQVSDNKIGVTVGSVSFVTKLIEADFPDYQRVVPKNNTKVLEVDKNAILGAIKRVSVIYEIKGLKGVRFIIENDTVSMIAVNQFGDKASESAPVVFSDKERFETAYNPQFIADAVANVDGDKVRITFSDPMSPMLIQAIDTNNPYYVVMPMRS